ncbi:MAG: phosphonate C-P lyase system protein PhnL [Burkholderiales bacterium]
MEPVLHIKGLTKSFTLHLQGGARLDVLRDFSLEVARGECVALVGPSGAGKSTILKCVYGTCATPVGTIRVHPTAGTTIDITSATDQAMLRMRRDVIGYASQFLRVIPRISTLDLVADEWLDGRDPSDEAIIAAGRQAAEALLTRLALDRKLWSLPPATFSGGEQQRVNLARTFVRARPLLLLDEPTASLDTTNAARIVRLINDALSDGCAMVGVFHDEAIRAQVATRCITVERPRQLAMQ